MVDEARRLALDALAEARERRLMETAARAENQPPPVAQYVGFDCKTGEALIRPLGGGIVRCQPLYNTAVKPGDLIDLHVSQGLPKGDNLSAFEPEPVVIEPEPVEVFGKLKILFYTPDGGLWIGGDRAVPKRIGQFPLPGFTDATSTYKLANKGDGDRWVVSVGQTSQGLTDDSLQTNRFHLMWLPTNKVVEIEGVTSHPGGGFIYPSLSYTGGGYWQAIPDSKISFLSSPYQNPYFPGGLIEATTNQIFNLTRSASFGVTGQVTDSGWSGGTTNTRTVTAEELTGSYLLTAESTALVDSSLTVNQFTAFAEASSTGAANNRSVVNVWVSGQTSSPVQMQITGETNYSGVAPDVTGSSFSLKEEEYIDVIAMDANTGYWRKKTKETHVIFETINGTAIPTTTITESTKYFFGENEVDATLWNFGFKLTVARGTIYKADLTTPDAATIAVGFAGQTFTTPYHPIPTEATIIDWSYHP